MTARRLWGAFLPVLSLLLSVEAPARPYARGFPFPGDPVPADVRQDLLDGSTAFALDLHARLAEKGGNLVFSPLGVAATVGMLSEAARGETRAQLVGLLHGDGGGGSLGPSFRSMLSDVGADATRDVQVRFANALWTRRDLPFEPAFLEVLGRDFGARASSLDFARDPERARRTINRWGRRFTGGLVPEVLTRGSVTTDTAFVVSDAVSLRAKWETPFPLSSTGSRPFTLADGTAVEAPTMRLRRYLPFFRGGDFVAAELPCAGGDFSMLLLVPDSHDGLPALEADLTPALLAGVTAGAAFEDAILYLPRFSIEADLDLEAPLAALGAAAAFDPDTADFSAAAGAPGEIFVSTFRQGAVIRVTEAGIAAAAVTASGFEFTSAPPVIAADRPFLFLVRHRPTGTVLFMGRVADPR